MIVTDIVMPGLDGIAATLALCARRPGTRLVLVTFHDAPELAERAKSAGALAFVSKHRAGDELVPAVRAALHEIIQAPSAQVLVKRLRAKQE